MSIQAAAKWKFYGTQFNVEAYNENEFSTALIRGSVKVTDKSQPDESVVLEPNNTVSLNNGKLTVTPITDFNPYSWKDGLITFKDINFKDLMKKLEKKFRYPDNCRQSYAR